MSSTNELRKKAKVEFVLTVCAASMCIGAAIAKGSTEKNMISNEYDVREAIARVMVPFENGFTDAELERDLHDMFTDEFYIFRKY